MYSLKGESWTEPPDGGEWGCTAFEKGVVGSVDIASGGQDLASGGEPMDLASIKGEALCWLSL